MPCRAMPACHRQAQHKSSLRDYNGRPSRACCPVEVGFLYVACFRLSGARVRPHPQLVVPGHLQPSRPKPVYHPPGRPSTAKPSAPSLSFSSKGLGRWAPQHQCTTRQWVPGYRRPTAGPAQDPTPGAQPTADLVRRPIHEDLDDRLAESRLQEVTHTRHATASAFGRAQAATRQPECTGAPSVGESDARCLLAPRASGLQHRPSHAGAGRPRPDTAQLGP